MIHHAFLGRFRDECVGVCVCVVDLFFVEKRLFNVFVRTCVGVRRTTANQAIQLGAGWECIWGWCAIMVLLSAVVIRVRRDVRLQSGRTRYVGCCSWLLDRL